MVNQGIEFGPHRVAFHNPSRSRLVKLKKDDQKSRINTSENFSLVCNAPKSFLLPPFGQKLPQELESTIRHNAIFVRSGVVGNSIRDEVVHNVFDSAMDPD